MLGQTATTTASGQGKEDKPLVSKHTGVVVKEAEQPVVKKELISGQIPQTQQQTQGTSALLSAASGASGRQGTGGHLFAANQAQGANTLLGAATSASGRQGTGDPLSAANQAQGANALLFAANQAQGANASLFAANQAQGANALLSAANQAQGANALMSAANQAQGTGTLLPAASTTSSSIHVSGFKFQYAPISTAIGGSATASGLLSSFNFSTSTTPISGTTWNGMAQPQLPFTYSRSQQGQPSTSTPMLPQQMQPGTVTASLHIEEEPVFTIVDVLCRSAL